MIVNGIECVPFEGTLVIPRPNGKDIPFKAAAVKSYDKFDEMCPLPTPPTIQLASGETVFDFDDEGYKAQLSNHNDRRLGWTVMQSLEPSNITWSILDPNKPATWSKWRTELEKAGFSDIEVRRIFNLVREANGLDEDKIEAARQAFLASSRKESESSSCQTDALLSTGSGEPA